VLGEPLTKLKPQLEVPRTSATTSQHARRQVQAIEIQIPIQVRPVGARAYRDLQDAGSVVQLKELQVSFATCGFGAALPPTIKAGGNVVNESDAVVQILIVGVRAFHRALREEDRDLVADRVQESGTGISIAGALLDQGGPIDRVLVRNWEKHIRGFRLNDAWKSITDRLDRHPNPATTSSP
jgi:hypothetical protein